MHADVEKAVHVVQSSIRPAPQVEGRGVIEQSIRLDPLAERTERQRTVEVDLHAVTLLIGGTLAEPLVEPLTRLGEQAAKPLCFEDRTGHPPLVRPHEEIQISIRAPGRIGIEHPGDGGAFQDDHVNTLPPQGIDHRVEPALEEDHEDHRLAVPVEEFLALGRLQLHLATLSGGDGQTDQSLVRQMREESRPQGIGNGEWLAASSGDAGAGDPPGQAGRLEEPRSLRVLHLPTSLSVGAHHATVRGDCSSDCEKLANEGWRGNVFALLGLEFSCPVPQLPEAKRSRNTPNLAGKATGVMALFPRARSAGSIGASGTLTVFPHYAPRKRADVLELDMGDGVILYNHDSSLVHHLNPSASITWHLCDGHTTIEELAAEISSEFALNPSQVLADVSAVVAELDVLGLVEDAGVSSEKS